MGEWRRPIWIWLDGGLVAARVFLVWRREGKANLDQRVLNWKMELILVSTMPWLHLKFINVGLCVYQKFHESVLYSKGRAIIRWELTQAKEVKIEEASGLEGKSWNIGWLTRGIFEEGKKSNFGVRNLSMGRCVLHWLECKPLH